MRGLKVSSGAKFIYTSFYLFYRHLEEFNRICLGYQDMSTGRVRYQSKGLAALWTHIMEPYL